MTIVTMNRMQNISNKCIVYINLLYMISKGKPFQFPSQNTFRNNHQSIAWITVINKLPD